MKNLSINTKNGIKIIRCLEFDGSYESFKNIWNFIHNQMMLLALRYEEYTKNELSFELVNISEEFYTSPKSIIDMWLCKDVNTAWKQALIIDGWYEKTFNERDIINDFKLDNLFVLIEDIQNKRIIFKKLSIYFGIDDNNYTVNLLVDRDNMINGLYISESDFVDKFYITKEQL